MNSAPLWKVSTSKHAQKHLARAPRPERERLLRVLEEEMTRDPFAGDVVPLANEQATFRRRVGNFRIFFDVDRTLQRVEIADIKHRTTTTYRKKRS